MAGIFLAVSCALNSVLTRDAGSAAAGEVQGDPLYQLLGSAREALGDAVYMKADTYLHSGLRSDLLEGHDEEGEHGTEEEKQHEIDKSLSSDWIGSLYNQVNVVEHMHLADDQTQELLPILDLATRLNPHNVNGALTAAYWLYVRFHDSDRAIGILRRSAAENPDEWDLEFQMGKIYLESKKDFAEAARHLKAAVEKLEHGDHTPFDAIEARYSLAEAYFGAGDYSTALLFYKQALESYPGDQRSALKETIVKRIAEIEAKAAPSAAAS